jgi:hypothetical protein
MIQAGNTTIPVYIFKGTEEGVGTTDTYMWIPNKTTALFPSVIADIKMQGTSGIAFETITPIISTLNEAPSETLVPITNSGLKTSFETSAAYYNVAVTGISINFGKKALLRFRMGTVKLRHVQNTTGFSEFEYCVYWDNTMPLYTRINPKFSNITNYAVQFYLDSDDNVCMWISYGIPANQHFGIDVTCALSDSLGTTIEYFTPTISFVQTTPTEVDAGTTAKSVNQEPFSLIDVNNEYNVARPDVWIVGQQIWFSGKLRGVRFTGTYDTGAANTEVVITLGNDSAFPNNMDKLIAWGGHMGGITNFTDIQFPLVINLPQYSTSNVKLINGFGFKPSSTRQIILTHTDGYASISTAYDVWFLYTIK